MISGNGACLHTRRERGSESEVERYREQALCTAVTTREREEENLVLWLRTRGESGERKIAILACRGEERGLGGQPASDAQGR